MAHDLTVRFQQAWKAYVVKRLAEEPGLLPGDIRAKDVAKRIEGWLVGERFTAQTFSKILSGKQKPSGSQLAAIALELGADYFELAGVRKRRTAEWHVERKVEIPPHPPLSPPAELVSTPVRKRRKGQS